MQKFQTFENVCNFLVQSKLDPNYIKFIDKHLEKSNNKDMTNLVKQVKAFHSMRKTLCLAVFNHFNHNSILNEFANARGIEQYKKCPAKSQCAISQEKIKSNTGILCILDKKELITIHSRYKLVLYHFFVIAHLSEEIGLEAVKWLEKQPWWQCGKVHGSEECTKRLLNYNNHGFAKGMYIKIKTSAEYIEKELCNLPIKH